MENVQKTNEVKEFKGPWITLEDRIKAEEFEGILKMVDSPESLYCIIKTIEILQAATKGTLLDSNMEFLIGAVISAKLQGRSLKRPQT